MDLCNGIRECDNGMDENKETCDGEFNTFTKPTHNKRNFSVVWSVFFQMGVLNYLVGQGLRLSTWSFL